MRTGEDTVVNGALFERGYSAYREQANTQLNQSTTPPKWIVQRLSTRG